MAIRYIGNRLNEYLNKLLKTDGLDYVCYTDTDSCYVVLDALVSRLNMQDKPEDTIVDFIDKVSKEKLEPFIDQCYRELAAEMNAHSHQMFMKRENISVSGIWNGKKRYAMHVRDSEGVRYEKRKLKYVGLEAKRSNVPEICRGWLEVCYDLALSEKQAELHTFVAQCQKEYYTFAPEEVAAVSTANNIAKFQQDGFVAGKGTPRHIKGVINHNKLASLDTTRALKPITESEKVMIVEMSPKKNKYGFEVFAFTGYFPRGYDLEKAIDYGVMFEKNFIEPLKNFLGSIGWTHEKINTVDDFFA